MNEETKLWAIHIPGPDDVGSLLDRGIRPLDPQRADLPDLLRDMAEYLSQYSSARKRRHLILAAREIDALRLWVARHGAITDTCTRDALSLCAPAEADWRDAGEVKLLEQMTDAYEGLKACGWKEISCCPKDGARVELMNAKSKLTDVGVWCDYTSNPHRTIDGEWCTDRGNGDMTHWRICVA